MLSHLPSLIALSLEENRFSGEFHKLIAIGTPHQGTKLASFLLKYRCDWAGVFATANGACHSLERSCRTNRAVAAPDSSRNSIISTGAAIGAKPASRPSRCSMII